MTDEEYFSHYMLSFKTIFTHNAEDRAFIKDVDFKYQFVTDKMIKFLGAASANEVLGKTLTEVAHIFQTCDVKLASKLAEQELEIKTHKRKRRVYLEVLNINGKSNIALHYKTPLVNPDTGNFIGIRGQVTSLMLPHMIKILFNMHGSKGLLMSRNNNEDNPLKDYPLSNIQHMVLFLAINNHSYSEIAMLLSEFGYQLTPSRVNDYLEQLKFIFHVSSKTQLIEKAIGLNLQKYLPQELFNKPSSIEVGNTAAKIGSEEH